MTESGFIIAGPEAAATAAEFTPLPEKPMPGKTPQKPRPEDGERPAASENKDPILKRAKPGAGSYEDPADAARQKRRPGKTGRPGR